MNFKKCLRFALVSCVSVSSLAFADGDRRAASKSVLSAEQEVASTPVASDGLANGIISFKRNFRSARVRVTFSNLEGEVTRLHLHCAEAGSNGPIAIGLVDLVAVAQDNSETVELDSNTIIGRISNRQFPQGEANQCGIYDLYGLANAIDAGGIYWNLHTTAFQPGELRGQVEPLSTHRYDSDD
ncbi:MAG: CHRD domain-containing protein [Pseudomonadota bacterium]